MNVLSLFDGMSCGRLALNSLGIKVDTYYSSEIDRHALKVANDNHPVDIPNRLGDVRSIDGTTLPSIDLLIGGSPCTSFSFIGKGNGMSTEDNVQIHTLEHYLELKEQGFEFNGQSYLFWEFMRLLDETKPKYFFLENVKMSKHWEEILNKAIGFNPIVINSNLVSAQNRHRLYWTNIPNITEIEDKCIYLDDVIDHTTPIYRVPRNYSKYVPDSQPKYCDPYNKSVLNNKSTSLRTNVNNGNMWIKVKDGYRNLTRNEAEKLQTVPLNYTSAASEAQGKKMLGNGWTIDIIKHIFSHM